MRHHIRTRLRRAAITALSLAVLGGMSLATAGSASAATGKNGVLEAGEFGGYFNSYQAGCVFDLRFEDGNHADDSFKGSCNGSGAGVNDNTASYDNRDWYTWHVYTDANGGGVHGWVPENVAGNYSENFKNKVSSAYYYLP